MPLRFASGHYTTLYTPLHYSTLHYTTLHNTTTTTTELHNYTPLHSTTLHYITLHYTLHTLQYIALLYTPQHYNREIKHLSVHQWLRSAIPDSQQPSSPIPHPGFTTTKLSYRFPIFETSATALCGTTGTRKLARSTSQYYLVLQSLHKLLPSTTLYYKACTKHFPVLLCTTKLAQSTFQYYFVLQILHKVVPSTALYYKACIKQFPVFCDFVLQSLRKRFPVRLCTTKLAQSTLHDKDTGTPEDKQRLRFCSFPHRHGDVSAAKQARLCSFPHRHGDARGQAETEVLRGKAEIRDETRFLQLPP